MLYIITSSWKYCDQASLFVGWFVCYVCLILINFGPDIQDMCQISLLTFETPRSEFTVKTALLKIFQCNSLDVLRYVQFTKFGSLADIGLPEVILALKFNMTAW